MSFFTAVSQTYKRCIGRPVITKGHLVRKELEGAGINPTWATVGIIKRMSRQQSEELFALLREFTNAVGTIKKLILPANVIDILGNNNNIKPIKYSDYRIEDIIELWDSRTRILDLSSIRPIKHPSSKGNIKTTRHTPGNINGLML